MIQFSDQLVEIVQFFKGAEHPLEIEDTLEIMSMLDAAERSSHSGVSEKV